MDIEYVKVGDYLLPTIKLSDPPNVIGQDVPTPLGHYGLRHKSYLRENRAILYNQLLLTEQLYPLCREVDESAQNRLRTIVDSFQAEEYVAELIYE